MKNLIYIISLVVLGLTCSQAQHVLNVSSATSIKINALAYTPALSTAVLLDQNEICYYNVANSDSFSPEWIGMESVEVTAALQAGDDLIYFFDGSSFIEFMPSEGTFTSEWTAWEGLPSQWRNKLDATVRWSDSEIYFFKGDEYVVYDINAQDYTSAGNLSEWAGYPENWTHVDASFNLGDGHIYFLNADQFLVYDLGDQQFYPVHTFEGNQLIAAQKNISTNNSSPPKKSIEAKFSRNNINIRIEEDAEEDEEDVIVTSENEEVEIEEELFVMQDEYLDDYEDHTSSLANDASDWTSQPLPGLDWLGAGFDIVKYDPLEPNSLKNRKKFRSVIVTNSPDRAGNKGQYMKPYGTFFGSGNAGKSIDTSAWVTDYKSFTNTMSINAGGSVKVPKGAAGSASGSHKEINSTRTGSESIYLFNKILRRIHEVDLRLLWKDKESGQKYKQKIDFEFKDAVTELPLPREAMTLEALQAVSITKKGDKLPSQLNSVKSKYNLFINRHGTHYASHVTWGGQYVTRTQIKRKDYEKSRKSETAFKADVEGTVKKVQLGGNFGMGMGDGTSNGNTTKNLKQVIYSQGGNGEDDLSKWRDKVDTSPAPVELAFTPICDLFIAELFPQVDKLDIKKEILRILTEYHIVNTYREAKDSRDDFFRELPEINVPGNLSITNKGGYVMWFTVEYKLDGLTYTKESGDFTLGFSKSIEVPVGASDITLKAAQTTSEIFVKSYDKPTTECFKCWGTIFKTAYGNCDE